MKGSRIAAILVFLFSGFLLWLCTGHDNPEVYLFPFIVSIALFALSALALGRELIGLGTGDIQSIPLLRLLPALLVIVAYVMAVEYFGMYSSSLVALFLLALIYHPGENFIQRITNSVLVSAGFIGVMYVLFSILLKVQTPRGLFL
ncbi:MAG: tripartite tricarboxylate transporter TctB family protein [Thiolinea sp.]